MKSPKEIIEQQLLFYNSRDLDNFCNLFDSSIEGFSLPNTSSPILSGIDDLRSRYHERFESSPNLHSKVKSRFVLGNFVIDDEEIEGFGGDNVVRIIAIYEVIQEQITRMWFIRGDENSGIITPVQQQLVGYNSQDIDLFLEQYTSDFKIFDLGLGELRMEGYEAMKSRYSNLFENSPELEAVVEDRMYLDNFVIDFELVSGFRGNQEVQAIAIYEIDDNLIKTVWFLK